MNSINPNMCYANNMSFKGRVDSSVKKYVKNMEYISKTIYVDNCNRLGQKADKEEVKAIEDRCATALKNLEEKAKAMHKDTVIKTEKTPDNSKIHLFLTADNKNLLLNWDQKGVASGYSIYENNLLNVGYAGIGKHDDYISQFEKFVDKIDPKKLDERLVQTSIFNMGHLPKSQILDGKRAERQAKATQKVAREIGYYAPFWSHMKKELAEVRTQAKLEEENSEFLPSLERFGRKFFGN